MSVHVLGLEKETIIENIRITLM